MKLYYHKTNGGAEYLVNSYYNWNDNGKRKRAGCFNHKTKYIVRIDGNIEKDAELTIKDEDN